VKDIQFLTMPLSVGPGRLRHEPKPFDFREEVDKLYAALRMGGNDLK
jgi:hypothetical protein